MANNNSTEQKVPYPTNPYPTNPYPTATYTTTGQPSNFQQPVVIIQQPALPVYTVFDKHPQAIVCPNCKANVVTKTESSIGCGTFLISALICALGGWLLCALIPCCVPACQDTEHYCPNCNTFVGKHDLI